jgi:hypothetical protein
VIILRFGAGICKAVDPAELTLQSLYFGESGSDQRLVDRKTRTKIWARIVALPGEGLCRGGRFFRLFGWSEFMFANAQILQNPEHHIAVEDILVEYL